MNNLQLFGKRIRELRKKRSITQEQLAEIIGLDVKQICNIETGYCFTTMSTLEKLAAFFNVEIYQLFNYSNIKSKEELIPVLIDKITHASEKEVQLITKIINTVLY